MAEVLCPQVSAGPAVSPFEKWIMELGATAACLLSVMSQRAKEVNLSQTLKSPCPMLLVPVESNEHIPHKVHRCVSVLFLTFLELL